MTRDEAIKRLEIIVRHSERESYHYEIEVNDWEKYGKSRTYFSIIETRDHTKHHVEREYGYIDNLTGEYVVGKNDLTINQTFNEVKFEDVETAKDVKEEKEGIKDYYQVEEKENVIIIRYPNGDLSLAARKRDTLEKTLHNWLYGKIEDGDDEEALFGAIEKAAKFFADGKKSILFGNNNHVWHGNTFDNIQMWQILMAKEDGIPEEKIELWANGELNALEMWKSRLEQRREIRSNNEKKEKKRI